jgi:hypothetical protein
MGDGGRGEGRGLYTIKDRAGRISIFLFFLLRRET